MNMSFKRDLNMMITRVLSPCIIFVSKKENVPKILNKTGGKYFRYLFVIWLATESVLVNNNLKNLYLQNALMLKYSTWNFFKEAEI